MWHLSERSEYLKVGRDKEKGYKYPITIFCIKITELTSFDFDYIWATALIWGLHLLTFFSQMQCLCKGGV